MNSNKVSFLALSCVGAFATAPAFADPTDPADPQQRRDDVVVEGQRVGPEDNPKLVAPLVNTPRSIVTLSSDVIEQTGSNSLADALRTVPGITLGAAEGGNPIGDRPFIRGFDSQGSIYVDGVRDLGAQSREVFAVDQVQVVRGSDSTLGGRGSAGGTLNIISRLPRTGTFGSVNTSYGEADYKRITGDLNLAISPTVGFRVQGLYHDQDVAGRDAIYQRRWGVAPSLTIGLGQPTRLTASYYYLESHELPDSGLPYRYTIGNAPGTGTILDEPVLGPFTTAGGQSGTIARSTFYGLTDRDFRDTTTNQFMLRAEHDLGPGLTLRNTARYNRTEQDYIYTQPDDQQGDVYGTTTSNTGTNLTSGGYVWRRANTRYGYTESIIDQTDLYGTVDTGGVRHSIAVGTEFAWEKARRGTFVTRGYLNATGVEILASGATITPRCTAFSVSRYYCANLFAPNPNDPYVNYMSDTSTVPAAIVRSLPQEETQNDGTTQAAYAFDSVTLAPSLILNLGVRFDRFTSVIRPGGTYTTTQQVQLERVDSLFNYQVGLVLKPTHESSIYASYATAATPPNALLGEGREDNALPTTTTAANLALLDSLKVQKTRSYEVGAKANILGGKLALAAAVFQTDINNARVTSDANTVEFIGRTRVRGVELTANGIILPGWTIFGGYTYLDPKVVDAGFTALAVAAVGTRAATTVQVPSILTGTQIPQTARHQFTATTNAELFHGFQIGGSALYTSRQYGNISDNRSATQTAAGVITVIPATKVIYRSIPAYWRFDARASYDVNEHLQLSVNAQNLFDKAYFSALFTNHYATIAPGRTVFGTIGVKF